MKYLTRSHFLLGVECFINFSLQKFLQEVKVERRGEQKNWWMQMKIPHLRSGLQTLMPFYGVNMPWFMWGIG